MVDLAQHLVWQIYAVDVPAALDADSMRGVGEILVGRLQEAEIRRVRIRRRGLAIQAKDDAIGMALKETPG